MKSATTAVLFFYSRFIQDKRFYNRPLWPLSKTVRADLLRCFLQSATKATFKNRFPRLNLQIRRRLFVPGSLQDLPDLSHSLEGKEIIFRKKKPFHPRRAYYDTKQYRFYLYALKSYFNCSLLIQHTA